MERVKRLTIAMSVILLTLNMSTMTNGFQKDTELQERKKSGIDGKNIVYSWGEQVTMYYPDGKTITVSANEVENYKKKGLTDNKEAFYTTMYSSTDIKNARILDVFKDYVDDYKKAGWIPKADLLTTLYSDDGRSIDVPNDQVDAYKAVGWKDKSDVYVTLYTEEGGKLDCLKKNVAWKKSVGWHEWDEIFQTLYSMDGRTIDVYKKDVESYKKVGWYEFYDLYTPMYSEDARTIYVWKDNVEDYEKVGWYTSRSVAYSNMYKIGDYFLKEYEVSSSQTNEYVQAGFDLLNEDYMTVLFSSDDRKLAVKNTEVNAYRALGWYTYKEYIDLKIDAMIRTRQFEDAMKTLETAEKNYRWSESKKTVISQKKQNLRYSWMKVINSPIAVIDSYVTDKYGYPEVNIAFRNISDKTITAFKIQFTCYDAYGRVTTDYPWLYNGTFNGVAERENIPSNEYNIYTWTLYSNERTASVKNVRIIEVAYSDGTTWHR